VAKGVNKALLLGHVGKDPEIRSTAGGTIIASFSLATSDRQKDSQGNWADKAEWHNLVAFNRTAEIVRDYVKKGTQLFVEGKIQTRSCDDKDSGQKKYRTEVLVNELSLLGGRGDSGASSHSNGGGYSRSNAGGYGQARPATSDEYYADQGITDDDILFETNRKTNSQALFGAPISLRRKRWQPKQENRTRS
jgi:single-strand DNA-binding protein